MSILFNGQTCLSEDIKNRKSGIISDLRVFLSGDAGNRTRVRMVARVSVYVRSQSIASRLFLVPTGRREQARSL